MSKIPQSHTSHINAPYHWLDWCVWHAPSPVPGNWENIFGKIHQISLMASCRFLQAGIIYLHLCLSAEEMLLKYLVCVCERGHHWRSVSCLTPFGGCRLLPKKFQVWLCCGVPGGLVASVLSSLFTGDTFSDLDREIWSSLIRCTLLQSPEIVLTTHPETFFNQKKQKRNLGPMEINDKTCMY